MSDSGPPSRRVDFEAARLALARVTVDTAECLGVLVANSARITAEALDVERVSVWRFDASREELRCLHLFERSKARHSGGEILMTRAFPGYCRALDSCRAIVADDARTHPYLTPGLDEYMREHAITSMLDVPIFRAGKVFGVVCHEHVGPPRRWTGAEIEFAGTVAEIVALMFEQADRVRAEEAFHDLAIRTREMERLRELRRLARGVAHDFNNVLTAAGTFASLMARGGGDPAELHHELEESLEVGRRLARELIRFSDPTLEEPGATTAMIGATVVAMSEALRLLVRPLVTLRVVVQRHDAPVALRPLELEQILLNLCMNARDAIHGTGEIEIFVGGEKDVVLEVRDTGSGMTDDVQRRSTDPYFTTKDDGTGIGLAVVLDNVSRAGGTMEIDSVVGRGTTVRVIFPIAAST